MTPCAGLEKCERNVLPVLNNLLENREMSLDDGRFLMRCEVHERSGAAALGVLFIAHSHHF